MSSARHERGYFGRLAGGGTAATADARGAQSRMVTARQILRRCVLGLAAASALCAGAWAEPTVFDRFVHTAEDQVPEASLIAPHGVEELQSYRGRFVLLHFWATWCAPCITELPGLDALQRSRASDAFAVVAVSVDRIRPERVEAFLRDLGVEKLTAYQDRTGALTSLFNVVSFPTTFLIGSDGKLIGRLEHAADWDSPEAAEFLDRWSGH